MQDTFYVPRDIALTKENISFSHKAYILVGEIITQKSKICIMWGSGRCSGKFDTFDKGYKSGKYLILNIEDREVFIEKM